MIILIVIAISVVLVVLEMANNILGAV